MSEEQRHELTLDSGIVGFTVIDRNEEPVGEVMRVSLDGLCLLVARHKGLFGRNKEHAIHGRVITAIDADTRTVTVASAQEQVEQAPAYSNLDKGSSERLANYYA